MIRISKLLLATTIALSTTQAAFSETKITYKSAKTTSSYYKMGVEIAQAMKQGSNGDYILTVEESQGSVQNVMESAVRGGDYVFTTPPVLVKLAQSGKVMFKNKANPKYLEIRALFPIPSLTMHFVVSDKSGIKTFADMQGKKILLGKGSFGAREGAKYLKLFGLEGKVNLAEVALSDAAPALKTGQIDGFVTAGSYPAPNVVQAMADGGANLLSLTEQQIEQSKRTSLVIPAHIYTGQSIEVNTTSLPVVAYSTTAMDDKTAYELTKIYWEQKNEMSQKSAWWKGVSSQMLVNVKGKIHPGAAKYYTQMGILLTDSQQ